MPVDTFAHGRALLRFLAKNREKLSPLLILTHDFPDPDALASAYGLQHLAQSVFGLSARIAYCGEIGRMENKTMVRLLRIPARRFRPSCSSSFCLCATTSLGTRPIPMYTACTALGWRLASSKTADAMASGTSAGNHRAVLSGRDQRHTE